MASAMSLLVSVQASLAYTFTSDQVCWFGVGKVADMVAIFTPPDTLSVMILLVTSTVMRTVEKVLSGQGWVASIAASWVVPVPVPMYRTAMRVVRG